MNITNVVKHSISVPLPQGKKLFLGPGKSGQITAKAAQHPPLMKLVEAGELEIDAAGSQKSGPSFDGAAGRSKGQSGGAGSDIRRTGNR
jgi:hypothetical protein